MTWCLTASSYYLNQYWLTISEVQSSITWGKFHKKYLNHQLLKLAWKLLIWFKSPMSIWDICLCAWYHAGVKSWRLSLVNKVSTWSTYDAKALSINQTCYLDLHSRETLRPSDTICSTEKRFLMPTLSLLTAPQIVITISNRVKCLTISCGTYSACDKVGIMITMGFQGVNPKYG